MGSSLRDTPSYSYRDDVLLRWDVSSLRTSVFVENDNLSGLFLYKNALSVAETNSVVDFIASSCVFSSQRNQQSFGPNRWTWYEFDPARYMAGCRPFDDCSAVSNTIQEAALEHFEVFNKISPSDWLSLTSLSAHPNLCVGARILHRLQRELPQKLPKAHALHGPLKCLFLQFQLMEMGTSIAPHVDAHDPPCDLIATVCVTGKNVVRVGGTEFCLTPGDAYILSGAARNEVKHEVLTGMEDRLSVTFRFTSNQAVDIWKENRAAQTATGP